MEDLILNLNLDFQNSNFKIYFEEIWAENCPFDLKIGTYCILEVVIPDPELACQISDRKMHFFRIWSKKSQNCLFCLKIGTHGVLEGVIPNTELGFQNFETKILFWANLDRKSIPCLFSFDTVSF